MLKRVVTQIAGRLLFAFLLLSTPAVVTGALIIDPADDFIDVFTGPENGDLDVLRAEVFLDPAAATLAFTSTSADDIGLTPTGIFVWGVNRGAGFANFADIGLPDVRFDAVVVITAGGGGFVTTLDNGAQTNLQASAISINGPNIAATVPLSLLPSLGFSPAAYTVNLWPRSAPVIDRNEVISDFAPDATNAAVTVVPEPGTAALVSIALAAVACIRRRRR